MSFRLLIGDRAYSSWSLRAWLICELCGQNYEVETTRFYCKAFQHALHAYRPARTVPVLKLANGTVIADSMAIAEELAQRYPDANLWPADPDVRATARMVAAEMHAAFSALRSECPMNLRVAYRKAPVSDEVTADIARLAVLWDHARDTRTEDGPWLFGRYTIADAFFAPVAARIAGYGLGVEGFAAGYVAQHLAHLPFRRWRAMSLVDGADQPDYAREYETRPWPGPEVMAADVEDTGTPVNALCPYTGGPATHLLRYQRRIFGFASAFHRNKTVSDPGAWPEFIALTEAR